MKDKDFDIKEAYEKISKKYSLPGFEKLDNEFEISFIDKEAFLIRSIRRKMNEKVIFFCRIIEGVLFPQGASYISAVESKALTDEEKQNILEVYKKLMGYERRSLMLDTDSDDEKDARYIKSLYKEWPEFKKVVGEFVKKLEKAWKQEEESPSEGFFG